MPIQKDDAEQNLKQFLAKYGREGFLKLFLTNYLFEMLLFYLHSKPRKERDDTSYSLYVNPKGQTYSNEQIDSFKSRLRKECANRAESIVKTSKELGLLERLGEDPTKDPEISELLQQAFDSIIKEFG